ncbi:MAG: response regulator [Elusimicrobia bacterium]|nr:response regulator [Candidatus Obscuribacterium magneticum]
MNIKNAKKAYGTYDVARICQVTPPTVGRWIEAGKLPSFTTGGGHHRVWVEDLVVFLKAHNMPVPSELLVSGKSSILIVDDEKDIRVVIASTVRTHFPAVDIHEASDGFEAGQKTTLLCPSLVVLDLRLPGIDGIKVCEMIRQNGNLKSVKILAMTGYNVEETRQQAMEAGADGFLGKPFDPKELADGIRRLLI